MSYDDVYFRIYRKDGKIIPVCMQAFDEHDYDQELFVTERKFKSGKDALSWIETYNWVFGKFESIEELNREYDVDFR